MKKIISKIALTLISLFICSIAFTQINFKQKQIGGTNYFAVLEPGENIAATLVNEVAVLKQLINSNATIEFRFLNSYVDDLKFTHKKYSIFYAGVEIKGMDFVLHQKEGIIQYVNGTYEDIGYIITKPFVNELAALNNAKTFFEASIKAKGANNFSIENKGFCIIKNSLLANTKYELAYKIIIDPNSANGKYVFVSAINGNIINYENLFCNTNAPGTAQTRYSGTQNFTTDQQGTQYRLREVRNGVNIKTLNANYESNVEVIVNIATDFWDTNDNNWTVAEHGVDQVATDAHWAMEKTYDYWLSKHNRNSINNAGMDIVSYIHFGNSIDNAFWNGGKNSMFFGDGASIFRPLTSIDVCAHELGHGICQYTSNLSYSYGTESSAMNEGFSDIWGASVEAYAAPNKQRWLIGEEITLVTPGYLRSMSNPPSGAFIPSSDTYGDANWNNEPDAHYRSGVLNKWYYLLSDGGSGTNGIGNTYNVTGITISKAEKIAYRTEQLLNSNANFAMARTMSIQAAQELYGVGSCEEISVIKAWYAVGVGAAGTVYSIIGSNNICSSHQGQYNISPVNANTTWSVSGITGATVSPVTGAATIVTIPSSVNSGSVTLTATIPGACQTVVTKQIQVITGTAPSCSTRIAYWYVNGYQTALNKCAYLTQIRCTNGNQNILSLCEYYAKAWVRDQTATTISWSYVSSSGHTSWTPNGDSVEVVINANSPHGWIRLKCTTSNVCGSYGWDFWFTPQGSTASCQVYFDPNCIVIDPLTEITKETQEKVSLVPNPTKGQFVVSLKTEDKNAEIKEIIIRNKMGIPVYQQKFANKQKKQTINLFNQPTDIYLVEVFDGVKWVTEKLSLQR